MLGPNGRTSDPSVRLTLFLTQTEPQPRTFPSGSAAKAPLAEGGEAFVDLLVAQAWGWGLSRSGFISAAGKAGNHPFSF